MHIAVFDANIDTSPFAARHPREVDKFRTLLGPRAAGWQFSDFAVHKGVFPAALTGIGGIMISGSPASVNERLGSVARSAHAARPGTQFVAGGVEGMDFRFGRTIVQREENFTAKVPIHECHRARNAA